jgi:hypothetical protein
VRELRRIYFLLLLVLGLGLTAAPMLLGKGNPVDIMLQSTTDVYGELAPCG